MPSLKLSLDWSLSAGKYIQATVDSTEKSQKLALLTSFCACSYGVSLSPQRFSAFQSVSAFSNTGMSLVDLSMLPFQDAYVMIFVGILLTSL